MVLRYFCRQISIHTLQAKKLPNIVSIADIKAALCIYFSATFILKEAGGLPLKGAPNWFDNHSFISGSPRVGGCLSLHSFTGLSVNGSVNSFILQHAQMRRGCYQHVYMVWSTFRRYYFYMFPFPQYPKYSPHIFLYFLIYYLSSILWCEYNMILATPFTVCETFYIVHDDTSCIYFDVVAKPTSISTQEVFFI